MAMTIDPVKINNLQKLISPSSIAIIGASDKAHTVGNAIFRNLLYGSFKGVLYPVNPKTKSVSGVKSYLTVNDIDEDVDLAIIMVPRNNVAGVLEDCGKKGISAAIVITAGFREIGEEGKLYEEQLIKVANYYGISLVGPNCFGIINTDLNINLNATFARVIPSPGNVAFISQSGSAGAYALEYAAAKDIGLSKFVSIGNKAILNENDFLKAFADDESTRLILCYIENFENPAEFIRLAREITSGENPKPILVIKSGRSKSGHRAAASHTGALVEQDDLLDHLFRQCGVLRVDTMEALFELALCFSRQPLPRGGKTAIITNAGGPAIIACDEAEKYGLEIPELGEEAQQTLQKSLPETVSTKNPVDLVGDADANRYDLALKTVLADDTIDMVQVLAVPQVMTKLEDIATVVAGHSSAAMRAGKPLVTSFAGFGSNVKIDNILAEQNIPNYTFPESAVKAMGAMADFARWTKRLVQEPDHFVVDRQIVKKIIEKAESEDRIVLTQPESYAIFSAYGFEPARNMVATSLREAVKAAGELGYPLAMKVISPDVLHKFDWGGVKVNIRTEEQLITAYEEIIANIRSKDPKARIDGILIQEMVKEGVELILGAIKNPSYGHLIMIGLGGTYVEVFKDVSFRLAPVTHSDAIDMIHEIKAVDILSGYRGIPPSDIPALGQLLQRLSQLVTDFPQISEIDLNPVFAMTKGAKIADVRLLLENG